MITSGFLLGTVSDIRVFASKCEMMRVNMVYKKAISGITVFFYLNNIGTFVNFEIRRSSYPRVSL